MQIRLIVPNLALQPGQEPDETMELTYPVEKYGPAIADIAGGFTASQAVGGWMNVVGKLIQEPVTVFDIDLAEHDTTGRILLQTLAKRICQELSQDCVYLRIDGEVELVEAG